MAGLGHHGSKELQQRFLPGMINGTEALVPGLLRTRRRLDLASLTTTATRDGDDYVINGHKIWTSYSDVADWCLLLARTDKDVPRHKGISAFMVDMHQPGIEQRPLKMINGVTNGIRSGAVRRCRVPADPDGRKPRRRLGAGDDGGQSRTRTVHPRILGALREDRCSQLGLGPTANRVTKLAWAAVQVQVLRQHVRRRLSEQLDGITHGPEGSIDKLLMTWVEQSVGHAVLAADRYHATPTCSAPTSTAARRASWVAPRRSRRTSSRRESSEWRSDMYDMPNEIEVEADGALRIITLNRPEELNAVNDDLHVGLARLWSRLNQDRTRTRGGDHRCGQGVFGRRRLQLHPARSAR